MRPLSVERLREYKEVDVAVTSWSTIRVKHNAYSVPSRLIGEWVRVRVYEDRLEVYHGSQAPAQRRAAARPQRSPDQLPSRHPLAGAQAGSLRALPLP